MNCENEDHTRCIVHLHIDQFYMQVEAKGDANLLLRPIAVQQNEIVALSNESARKCGVTHLMNIEDVLQLHPEVVIYKWSLETFHVYRQLSYKVTAFLQTFSSRVERLGLDENFVDITHIIQQRLGEQCGVIGQVHNRSKAVCGCGCFERLKIATKVVQEIREAIKREFNLTSHAGIAHNKLIASLCSELCLSNHQIVVFPPNGRDLVMKKSLRDLPGYKSKFALLGDDWSVKSIRDLLDLSNVQTLPKEKASLLRELALGIDNSPVRGRFASIGDSHRAANVESEVKDVLHQLLKRLIALAYKDGRVPKRIELLVRKTDGYTKHTHKIIQSMHLHGKLLVQDGKLHVSDTAEQQLVAHVMKLFRKAVDVSRSFHIMLLGLSFRRFHDSWRSLMTPLLREKMEVQIVTNIESKYESMKMDVYNGCSDNTDGSESEMEPSPKKKRMTIIRTARCCPSPSKLNVAQLRINSETN